MVYHKMQTTSVLSRLGQSRNAGSMVAMGANSLLSATSYGTRGKSLARRPRRHVPTAVQNSREQPYVVSSFGFVDLTC